MEEKKPNLSRLAPIMLAFFTMGFVDMVGTATNYVKADFALSDTMANFLPSMVFSRALLYLPEKNNEMSGLMIMGLIGGTIFPLLMGVLSDTLGTQIGSVLVISLGVIYLIYLAYKFLKDKA